MEHQVPFYCCGEAYLRSLARRPRCQWESGNSSAGTGHVTGQGDAPCLVWLTNPDVSGEAPPILFCPVSCHRSERAGCWRTRGFLPKPRTSLEALAGSVRADGGEHEASARSFARRPRYLLAPCGRIVESAPTGAPGTPFRV